jgi:hypothetical protein
MTKIVDFNKARKTRDNTPETPSEVAEAVYDAVDYSKVDELQTTWMHSFMDMLDDAEIGDDSEEFWRLYALWGEMFRAIIAYDQELPHPFQELAEKMVNVNFDNEGNAILEFKDVHLYVTDTPLIDDDGNTSI